MSTLANKDYHLAFEQVLRVNCHGNFLTIYAYRSLMANSDAGTHSHSCISVKESGQQVLSHIKIPAGKRAKSISQVRMEKGKKGTLVKEKDGLKGNNATQRTTEDTSLTQEESAAHKGEQPTTFYSKGSGHNPDIIQQ